MSARPIVEADVCAWGLRAFTKQPGEPREEVVAKVMAWIRERCKPRKTLDRRKTSYDWKHEAESRDGGIGEYVAQGEFIVAALRLGYRAGRVPGDGPSVYLNMRRKRLDAGEDKSTKVRTYSVVAV